MIDILDDSRKKSIALDNDLINDDSIFYDEIIGSSSCINNLRNAIQKAASNDSRVLIEGATGSGKCAIAKIIHNLSRYSCFPFKILHSLQFNKCDDNIILYGKEDNGIITPGIIEQCSPGIILLAEISEFPLDIQEKITKILQEQKIKRIGGVHSIKITTRFLSSSAKNLLDEINTGKLNQDFYHRLNVTKINIPNLQNYISDLAEICRYFIKKITQSLKLQQRKISEDAINIMQTYHWPGNTKELIDVLRSIIITHKNEKIITTEHLPAKILSNMQFFSEIETKVIKLPLKEARQEFERQYLKTQLTRFSHNITKTAQFIKMERSALYRKIKSLSID